MGTHHRFTPWFHCITGMFEYGGDLHRAWIEDIDLDMYTRALGELVQTPYLGAISTDTGQPWSYAHF